MKIKFQIIKIEDHHADNSDWVDPKTYKPVKKYLEYTGWVIQEDDEIVTLAQGRSMEGKVMVYDNLMHVMKKTVKKRRTIKID